jgi:DME family drug/metabolite transporter
LGIAIALVQAVCWAGPTNVLRALSMRMNPFLINGLRGLVGWLFVFPVALLTVAGDVSLLTPLRLVYILVSVLLAGVLGDYLNLCSLRILGVGRAFPITSSQPVFTVLLSALLLGDTLDAKTLGGTALVLFGVYLVARPRRDVIAIDNTPPLAPRQLLIGVLMALGTALATAGGTIVLALALSDGISPVMVNAVRLPVAVLVSLTMAGRQGQLPSVRRLDRQTLGLVLVAGVLGWAIGGTLYATAVQMIGPGKTALISSTSPIFAVPITLIFLKERPTRYTLIGTLITVVGIMLVV